MVGEQAPTPDVAPGSASWWNERYLSGDSPWDTGIVPPELVTLVSSGELATGWALDLGCGSGASSCYLAQHGFSVVGIDLAQSALVRARRAARAAAERTFFCRGDVSDLAFLRVRATFAVDVGCFHAVPPERRQSYVLSLAGRLVTDALYLLYAFEPFLGSSDGAPRGIGPAEIARFAPQFVLLCAQHGWDGDRPSAWYLFRRVG